MVTSADCGSLEKTQKWKDETYVHARTEHIVNVYKAKVNDRLSHMSTSPGGSLVQSTGLLSVPEADQIYQEVAPRTVITWCRFY
ncbi:unnamed protein product [Cochlearia groenlandica]